MPKFTRPNLPRGVKLAFENIWTSVSAIAQAMESPTIDADNLREARAPTRVNLWFPKLSGFHLYNHGGVAWADDKLRTRYFGVPFVLPPPAEYFDQSGQVGADVKPLVLSEVSVSFDQAGLGAMLCEDNLGNDKGTITYESAQYADIKITLLQKRMFAFGSDSYDPETEVFSGVIEANTLLDPNARANPIAWTGLNQQVDPYQSFMLHIEAPGLAPDANGSFANPRFLVLPSCCISLKFLSPLYDRDAEMQNAPDLNYATDSIAESAPTAGSLISATGATGLNTNLQLLSDKLLGRLRGGLRPDGAVPGYENRVADMTYDVLAVPMWHNLGLAGYAAAANAHEMPHSGPAPYDQQTTDEAWIPITHPFVIHHVFAANSIAVPLGQPAPLPTTKMGQLPTSGTLNTAIGVGIFSGVRGDDPAIDQVAYAAFTVAQRDNYVIDRVRVGREQQMSESPSAANGFTHDLFQVPVIGSGRDGFVTVGSSIDQGNPVYVGRGSMRTLVRTDLDGAAADCGGAEQFIVVRWSFHDSGGLADSSQVPAGAAANPFECYSGVGGSWVFIVGKRPVLGNLDNRRM